MVAQHEQNNYERARKNAHTHTNTHQTNDSNMMRQSLTGKKRERERKKW